MRVPVLFGVPVAALLVCLSLPSALPAAVIVFSGSGPAAANIQGTVEAFRAQLGNLNPNLPGSVGSGRREINWDGVPDALASPNPFPPDFFNQNTPGRARGVVFATPGFGFEVSANAVNPTGTPVQFGHFDPSYPGIFEPFSSQRLFSPIGSTITDVNFFIPGSNTAAVTTGFGAVFSDVDAPNVSSLTFFDSLNNSLGSFFVPAFSGDETFSFLGVSFGDAIVSRVRITSGNQALSPVNTFQDLVVMDDFIYGEPRVAAVPEPSTMAVLGGMALLSLPAMRRRKRERLDS